MILNVIYPVLHVLRITSRIICRDNSFSISDELLLPADTFTFVSSSHGSTSWLDHVLSTTSGHALVESVHVKTDFVSSDHLPLCFDISIDKKIICTSTSVCSTNDESPSFNWKDLTDNDLLNYSLCTKRTFLEFAFHLMPCSVMTCPVVLIKKILIIFIMILLTLYMDALENVFL